jgi:hypothetical protein
LNYDAKQNEKLLCLFKDSTITTRVSKKINNDSMIYVYQCVYVCWYKQQFVAVVFERNILLYIYTQHLYDADVARILWGRCAFEFVIHIIMIMSNNNKDINASVL